MGHRRLIKIFTSFRLKSSVIPKKKKKKELGTSLVLLHQSEVKFALASQKEEDKGESVSKKSCKQV